MTPRRVIKVQGQEDKGQRHSDITCAKIRKIINNSTEDCSITLKFHTDFDHVTLDVSRTFKVNGSQRDITYQHQKRYKSCTDKLSKVKLGENCPRAERNT